jgi:hypothetical protein
MFSKKLKRLVYNIAFLKDFHFCQKIGKIVKNVTITSFFDLLI